MVDSVPEVNAAAAAEGSVEERARAMITQLEQLDRSYFGKDRIKKIREVLDAACAVLDQKPIDLV